MNYYRRFPGDYLNDTMHLSAIEDGMYGRLLDRYYASEKPLPLDRKLLYAMVRAGTEEERQATESVLRQFFKKNRSGFVNNRASKEIQRASEIGRKRSTAAKSKTYDTANAQQLQSNCSATLDSRLQTLDSKQKSKEKSKDIAHRKPMSDRELPGFALFWESYPVGRKVGKPAARRAWLSSVRDDSRYAEVIAGLMVWKQTDQWQDLQFIPYPATFLNQKRWQDNPLGGTNGKPLTKAERRDQSNVEGIAEALRRRTSGVGVAPKILPGLPH